MATQTDKSKQNLKPGSNPADAAAVVGKGDFGVHENDVVGRTYTSENTKAADPGGAQRLDYERTGVRDHGAGGHDSGPGSSSGGDLDTDFIGLDGKGALATNIDKQATPDASDTDGNTSVNARSGGPAKGENQTLVGQVGGKHEQVNVVTPSDDRTLNTGADQISNAPDAESDDSFRGEISSAEASGRDNLGR